MSQQRKILITGGMGLVGTAFVKRFARTDRVTVADRLDFGISPEVEPLIHGGSVELLVTELSRPSELHKRVGSGEFDAVIHLASLTHIPLCEAYPDLAYGANVISVLNLLSGLPGRCKFVNFSSSATYLPESTLHEEKSSPLMPCDFYGWTKKHAEDLCEYYARKNQLTVLNIRLANAAGPGETNPKLLGTIFQQVQAGSRIIELGNLTPRRDFIHVDDIAWVIDELLQVWPVERGTVETYNVGTGYETISVEELFNKIAALLDGNIKLKSVQERRRKAERELLALNVTKLRKVLPQYKPKRIDEWLPTLVKDPSLRIPDDLEGRILRGYHASK